MATEHERSDIKLFNRPELEQLLDQSIDAKSGILRTIITKNPEMRARIGEFFFGNKPILVVGGESGMGKSLLVANLRMLYTQMQPTLPRQQDMDFTVISYDRTHQAFFDQVSTDVGETIALPKGETIFVARQIVSDAIADQIRFAYKYSKYRKRNPRIVIEGPLFGTRGETIFDALPDLMPQMQTFIMYSPESRYNTLTQGRLMMTSAHPDAMGEMRERLLKEIGGRRWRTLPPDDQDRMINAWWQAKLTSWHGIMVEWSPSDNTAGYHETLDYFQNERITSDAIKPSYVSKFNRGQLEAIFGVLPNREALLKKILKAHQ